MPNANWIRSLQMLVLGAILGGLFISLWEHPAAIAQQNSPQANPATMQADVAHLKDLTPPHSHPMVEVGMFAANLWFAGEKKNWPAIPEWYLPRSLPSALKCAKRIERRSVPQHPLAP